MASIRKRGKTYQVTISNGRDIYSKQLIETATFIPDPNRTEKDSSDHQQFFKYCCSMAAYRIQSLLQN